MEQKIQDFIKEVAAKNVGETEFLQAVEEVAEAIIPFMESMNHATKLSVSLLMGTIFVASSPSSAIAVISEMRAKGPFTNSSFGVTVIKDVLVIILFTIVFSFSKSLILSVEIGFVFVIKLFFELMFSFVLGYLLALLIS